MIWHSSPPSALRLWPGLFRPVLLTALLSALLSAASCTQVPELDTAVPDHLRHAAYPQLVTLDKSLTTPVWPRQKAEQIEQTLTARRERLQARARELNAPLVAPLVDPVVDPAARQRMQNGVTRMQNGVTR